MPEAAPFAGLDVLGEGGDAVVAALRERGAMVADEKMTHRYPYDWRSKQPVRHLPHMAGGRTFITWQVGPPSLFGR